MPLASWERIFPGWPTRWVSHEDWMPSEQWKHPDGLGFTGDCTTQLYRVLPKTIKKDPDEPTSILESRKGFLPWQESGLFAFVGFFQDSQRFTEVDGGYNTLQPKSWARHMTPESLPDDQLKTQDSSPKNQQYEGRAQEIRAVWPLKSWEVKNFSKVLEESNAPTCFLLARRFFWGNWRDWPPNP